jgi:hypothetical protein
MTREQRPQAAPISLEFSAARRARILSRPRFPQASARAWRAQPVKGAACMDIGHRFSIALITELPKRASIPPRGENFDVNSYQFALTCAAILTKSICAAKYMLLLSLA